MIEIPRTFPAHGIWRERVAFEVRGRPMTFVDVVQAAEVGEALAPIVRLSAEAQKAEARAAEMGLEADMEPVEGAIDEFRYARGLETVEETEAWLGRYGLGVDDLTGHFMRRHWLEVVSASDDAGELPGTESGEPVWHVDLVLDGSLDRLARTLAHQEVCRLGQPAPEADAQAALLSAFREQRGWSAERYSEWLGEWGIGEARLVELLHGAALYQAARGSVLSAQSKTRFLAEQRTALLRLDVESVDFDSMAAAQEAFLCVTVDRQELEAVAAESGFPMARRACFLRELPEAWRGMLMASPAGRTLPPQAGDGRYTIVRLRDRHDPVLTDPTVAAEVELQLLHRHFGEVEMREVRWRGGGGGAA